MIEVPTVIHDLPAIEWQVNGTEETQADTTLRLSAYQRFLGDELYSSAIAAHGARKWAETYGRDRYQVVTDLDELMQLEYANLRSETPWESTAYLGDDGFYYLQGYLKVVQDGGEIRYVPFEISFHQFDPRIMDNVE